MPGGKSSWAGWIQNWFLWEDFGPDRRRILFITGNYLIHQNKQELFCNLNQGRRLISSYRLVLLLNMDYKTLVKKPISISYTWICSHGSNQVWYQPFFVWQHSKGWKYCLVFKKVQSACSSHLFGCWNGLWSWWMELILFCALEKMNYRGSTG